VVGEDSTEWLEWNDSPDAPHSDSPKTDICLSDFIQLVGAPAQQILGFAREWGPLRQISDLRGAQRRGARRWRDGELTWTRWPGKVALHSNGRWRESVTEWRVKAWELSWVLSAAAHLQAGNDLPAELRANVSGAPLTTADDQWALVHAAAARHISLDDLHLEFRRTPGQDPEEPSSLVFVQGGRWPSPASRPLWTLLGLAMAAGIASPIGVYMCSNCGLPFAPKRRPHLTRAHAHHYCQACSIGDRGAKRTYYQRTRQRERSQRREESQTDE
jgi:hypothetical protein